ncbi:hypothetical protein CCR83_06080 [Rhodobacter veldkampii DSM 11550]|uniref:Uncharacterized protein n=1 Tax=Phaeovulum veldkampii DSM 11550 TaxID=1185920 RepID=A0A2T4JM82_9RHOB|nr:hypothetical protein [Phaeovulum veldkampii]MBK5946025.1 hypothetical protein [Phaeovulum veldkampii DSM 11550]PTE19004.1 hypothetical protein C5F46_02320 [Phaeovulum veldkampii DSM 11550]
MGAAIFAESRQWEGDQSARKTSRGQETVTGTISLTVDFKSRIAEDSARIRVTPTSEVPSGFEIEVVDEAGGTTGRKPFDGVVNLSVPVRKDGENRFVLTVHNAAGRIVEDLTREVTIVRTQASAASIPMTYTLAVKTQTGTVGYERNRLEPILKKGTALPAEGRHRFRAGKPLKAGEDDFITFEFYEMREGIDDPERNLHIGDFRMNGREDLERGERINRGDDLIVHWKMSDNGTLSFAVELPHLGRLIDSHNLYLAPGGHINFDGQQGAEVASMLLERAENDLEELNETLGGKADPSGDLRARIERLDAALSTSVDADIRWRRRYRYRRTGTHPWELMRQWQRQFDRNVWGKVMVLWWVTVDDINATSTCDCWHRAGLACESVRMLMFARTKTTPDQRLAS